MPAVLPDMDSFPLRPSEVLVRQVRAAVSEVARGTKALRRLVEEPTGFADGGYEVSCAEES